MGLVISQKNKGTTYFTDRKRKRTILCEKKGRLELIDSLYSGVVRTKGMIAKLSGVNIGYMNSHEDFIGHVNTIGEQKAKLLEEKFLSDIPIYKIRKELNITPTMVYFYAKKIGLDLRKIPSLNEYQISELLDGIKEERLNDCKKLSAKSSLEFIVKSALKGVKLSDIVDSLPDNEKVTKECVRTIVLGFGVYGNFKEARKNRIMTARKITSYIEEAKDVKIKLIKLMRERVESMILDEKLPFADRMTAKYIISFKNNHHAVERTVENVYKLFEIYGVALKNKEKLSLSTLATNSGFNSAMSAHDVLTKVGLPTMIRTYHSHSRKDINLKENIFNKLASEGKLSISDISYFSGISLEAVNRHISIENKRNIAEKKDEPLGAFSYKRASQFYESLDYGYNIHESMELIGLKNPDKATYLIDHRKEISETIIPALSKLHQNNKIDKPYL